MDRSDSALGCQLLLPCPLGSESSTPSQLCCWVAEGFAPNHEMATSRTPSSPSLWPPNFSGNPQALESSLTLLNWGRESATGYECSSCPATLHQPPEASPRCSTPQQKPALVDPPTERSDPHPQQREHFNNDQPAESNLQKVNQQSSL